MWADLGAGYGAEAGMSKMIEWPLFCLLDLIAIDFDLIFFVLT